MYEKPELDIIEFALEVDTIKVSSGDSDGWSDGGELDGETVY